jgi:hypothetical protein
MSKQIRGDARSRLRSGSRRSLAAACRKGDLPLPSTIDELRETFLVLLVNGIDHGSLGGRAFFEVIFPVHREFRPAEYR